jgi:ABC-type multidrug transport system fused ATPase/permease subunit
MGGLFNAVSAGLSKFVKAWLLPSATAVVLFAFLVLPILDDWELVVRINSLGNVERGLLLAFSIVLLALLSSYSSTYIYRLLEGYSWPNKVAARAVQKQQHLYDSLKEAAAPAQGADSTSDNEGEAQRWRAELAFERLKRYPESKHDILPTRLGNALKAIERYGQDRYKLDSQTLWSELNACAPDSTRDEVEDARSVVDTFVSFVFVSLVFAFLSLIVAIAKLHLPSLIAALVALLLSRWFYNSAVESTSWLVRAIQALVNLGRGKLASTYGLKIPSTLSEERKMWEALVAFVARGREDWAKELDKYRSPEELEKKASGPSE